MDDGRTAAPSDSQAHPRSRSASLSPAPEYIPQPDHFYLTTTSSSAPLNLDPSTSSKGGINASSRYQLKMNVTRDLRPEDDPLAARGIPVFKPSWWEFQDFEKYMNSIEPWGLKSGIVKVIPPKQWSDSLPDCRPLLQNIKIRHPIEQNMVGRSGLFRQQNIEKRRVYSLREWFELGLGEDCRTPRGDEVLNRDRVRTEPAMTRRSKVKKEESLAPETVAPLSPSATYVSNLGTRSQTGKDVEEDEESDGEPTNEELKKEATLTPVINTSLPTTTSDNTNTLNASDPMFSSSGEPDAATLAAQQAAALKAHRLALARERKAARAALRVDRDAQFLETFDPKTSWLPPGSTVEDYQSPDFVSGLERNYWRACGVGKEAMYGADLPGSLFSTNLGASYASTTGGAREEDYSIGIDKTWRVKNPAVEKKAIPWDVSNLPSALTRLLPRGMKLPGVNTPYLYFGMWKATFAWHVEDMDLFSINYLHWGAPKHWYAVPQGRANALETAMRSFFPSDKNGCPQFLRHKSYLASPTVLRSASIKPNVLVQNAGEFVITYPRGYHAGFNTGLNCAESVNFALDSWLDLGRKAKFCRCVSDSVRIDVDALLAEKALIEAEERAGIRRIQTEIRQARVKPILPPQAYVAPPGTNRPRKRKLEDMTGDGSVSVSSSRPDVLYAVLQPTAKKLRREVSTKVLPCVLCASPDREGLLPVNDKPFIVMGVATPIGENGEEEWMAHEYCAMVIPETWVDEVNGEKRVFGVDSIAKDRWGLRCGACTDPEFKAHGAPIQCTKGKCSKAFHVNCAKEGKSGSGFKVLSEQELEVLIAADAVPTVDPAPTNDVASSSGEQLVGVNGTLVDQNMHRVLKTIKKLTVELLCGQHNPVNSNDKRKARSDGILHALSTLPANGVIKIKLPTGVFECMVIGFDRENETVEVYWSNGQKKTHKWSTIIWNDLSQGAKLVKRPSTATTKPTLLQKPTKPKLAKPKTQPAKPPQPRSQPAMAYYGPSSSLPPGIKGATASNSHINPYYQLYNGQPPSVYTPYPNNASASSQVLVPAQGLRPPPNKGMGGLHRPASGPEMPKSFPLTRVDGSSSAASSDVDVSMTSHADEGKQSSSMDGSTQA